MKVGKTIIETVRLRLRTWDSHDIDQLAKVNADQEVMHYFPSTQTTQQTKDFILRMQKQQEAYGHCYFAVELKKTESVIGFIGLAYQDYIASFTPCVDIGCRLNKAKRGHGLATEGAKACLEYGHDQLKLRTIYAIAVKQNLPSIKVMEKIGMKYKGEFDHPDLEAYPDLKTCVIYTS